MSQTLRFGDRSGAVRELQRKLNTKGAKLAMDGAYGEATEAAVRVYQRTNGLVADGIAGPKTLASLAGADCGHLLKDANLIAAAERLGVELAVVYAVNEVESLGEGFLANGRPKILFERHVMYQRLALPRAADDDQATLRRVADELAAQYPSLVNTKPGGYIGGTAEHQRLAQARMLNPLCAYESASWGAFQVMGYHAPRLGYTSVEEFVRLMGQDEHQQFEAFVRFIEADPNLHKALKGKKWAAFAKGYNGPAYARNLYDVKLERAYEQHAKCGCGQEAA